MRALLVAAHPVQYASPQFRRYAEDSRLDVTVAYCSMRGAEMARDPDFGIDVRWDVPLLEGYRWIHPPNRAGRGTRVGFWSVVNPGLWSLIRQERFDVVVCYGYRAASFWIAAAAAKLTGSAVLLTTDAQTLVPRIGPAPARRIKTLIKALALPAIFRFGEGALAPSTGSVALLARLGVPPERIFLTPFVVDNEYFSSRAEESDLSAVRARWGIPDDAVVALFVGKLAPWKRPLDLLEAAARVDGLEVVFAGEGEQRSGLEARARALEVDRRVHFMGFVNQQSLPETYAAADVLVLPSEYEAFGVVVNEAFACGTPAIVSTACGSARDLVSEGETGYTYPPGDVEGLAGHLRRLLRDDALRRRLSENAKDRIAGWGPEQNAEAFAQACLTVAKEHR